jgi:hypothetical protein
MNNFRFILKSLLMLPILVSCFGSGTIENPDEKVQKYEKVEFKFSGIKNAVATAHDKIRVSFNPASGGSGKFNYFVYVNGNKLIPAATLSSSLAQPDTDNKIHVTVGDLSIGQDYSLVVNAQDSANGIMDANAVTIVESTLNYEVPDFMGIKSLDNIAGTSGKTQLNVLWDKANPSSVDPNGFFGGDVNAIYGYTIYYGTSLNNLYDNQVYVDDPDATSYKLTDLNQNTTYYVAVRARNSNTPQDEDLNLEYKIKKTKTDSPISFAGASSVSIPNNSSGRNQVNVSWKNGSGDFDYIRLFYKTTSGAIDPNNAATYTSSVRVDLPATTGSITGLTANTLYYVAAVACEAPNVDSAPGTVCESYQGHTVIKTITTSPSLASFNGLFAGTQGTAQGTGSSGLEQAILAWNPPSSTVGVYDGFKIYAKVNGTSTGELSIGSATTIGGSDLQIVSMSTSGAVITGLELGKSYSFKVNVYISGGAESNTNWGALLNPAYVAPGFNGVIPTAQNGCQQNSPSSVLVRWNAPNPTGMFNNYEIYFRVKTGTPFDYSSTMISGAANYTGTWGGSEYMKLTVPTTSTSRTISSLSPGVEYEFVVNTYFDNDGDEYRVTTGAGATICTVRLDPVEVTHNGWSDVLALGPKINGLTNEIIGEKIILPGDAGFTHRVPVEDDSCVTGSGTCSKTGLVRLAWNDFDLVGLNRTFCGTAAAITCDTNYGYNIYRSRYDSVSMPAAGAIVWTKINSTPILPQKTGSYAFAEYIDYTVGSELRDGDDADDADHLEAETYLYKVEPVRIDGATTATIDYSATPPDEVIKVILPPANKTLVHRWMANQQVCEDMGKTPDRENQYRCAYNGLGSKHIETDGDNLRESDELFYDFKGHLLSDRFELAVNFTRGNSANPCKIDTAPTLATWEGQTSDGAKGIIAGDCIGYTNGSTYWGRPVGLVPNDEDPNANIVYYSRDFTAGVSSPVVWVYNGGEWKSINIVDAASTLTYNQLENSDVSMATSQLVPQPNAAPTSDGLGKVVSTNKAKMPPFGRLKQQTAYKMCLSHSINFKNRKYYNRLLRRTEQVVAKSYPRNELISQNNATNIFNDEAGSGDKGCFGYLLPIEGTVTGVMNAGHWRNRIDDSNGLTILSGGAINDYYGLRGSYVYNYTTESRTHESSILISGSNATRDCVSRFGLQDFIGNMSEWASDTLWCDRNTAFASGTQAYSGTTGFCSPKYNNTSSTSTFTPPIDPLNVANYQNGDESWFNMGSPANYEHIFGEDPKAQYLSSTGSFDGNIKSYGGTPQDMVSTEYLSVVLGLPLQCLGEACTTDGLEKDDNLAVTARTTNPQNFNVPSDSNKTRSIAWDQDKHYHYLAAPSTSYNNDTFGLKDGLDVTLWSSYPPLRGRWSHIWSNIRGDVSENQFTGARCAVFLDETVDGSTFVTAGGNPLSSTNHNLLELIP